MSGSGNGIIPKRGEEVRGSGRRELKKFVHVENQLYPDFVPTLDNCDREPIHRPGAVQGHGILIAIDRKKGKLVSASENMQELLDEPLESYQDLPLESWLPEELLKALELVTDDDRWETYNPLPVVIKERQFDLIGHEYQGHTFLELEPLDIASIENVNTFGAIQHIRNALKSCQSIEELAQAMAKQLKQVTGYDRVMVYRFSEDWHGEVLGEAKEEELEPFLGLHYPATDIPLPARQLFLMNRVRIIEDIHLENSPLYVNPDYTDALPLDLSYAQLRATSPIHIEYLSNMGVHATFTVAIVADQKLWGLFAHHHYGGAYFLPYETRKTCEILSIMFSKYLIPLRRQIEEEQSHEGREKEDALFGNMVHGTLLEMKEGLLDGNPTLLELCGASGVAVILNEDIYVRGETPGIEDVKAIRDWLQKNDHVEVYSTNALVEEMGRPHEFASEAAGLLSACISEVPNMFILWFKPPTVSTVMWGGDPNKAVKLEQQENQQEIRLSPRKSFAKWKEEVKDKSDSWYEFEIDMAWRVREKLLRMEVERIGQEVIEKNRTLRLLNQELEQLIYIASHDLQEPLKTISNYIALIEEEGQKVLSEDLQIYMGRVRRSSDRMKVLIKDLLDYSRIGRSESLKEVSLNQTLIDIQEDMGPLLDETGADLAITDLPTIKGNPVELKRLFQNLISNALKFRSPDRSVKISIDAEPHEPGWMFSISDNGIGIAQDDLDKIFFLFQRLHSQKEYEGTGIGLAQCKKIVEVYGGEIHVSSEPGVGTTFHFTLKDYK